METTRTDLSGKAPARPQASSPSEPGLYIVDRLEGAYAVCMRPGQAGSSNVLLSELPEGVREGSHLQFDGGIWTLDTQAQTERHERIEEKMQTLFRHK